MHYWFATDNGLMTVAMIIVGIFLVKGLIDAGVDSFLLPKLNAGTGGRKKKKAKRG
jgi:hypothetical protein